MSSYAAIRIESHSSLKNLFLVMGATLLIALSGQISIPLPFTPIPLALQGHTCLLMAALLGRRLGSLSVALFLFMGTVGLPVFSLGGAGLPILLGPRGGYLMGYLLAAWITGTLIERKHTSTPGLKTLAMCVGNLVIYACGLPQLALFVGAGKVIVLGMLPFLAGDLVKLFISYRLMKSVSD
jgi:biotin transport system substrate-specific component